MDPLATAHARVGYIQVYEDDPSGTALYCADRWKEVILNFTDDGLYNLALALAIRLGYCLVPDEEGS